MPKPRRRVDELLERGGPGVDALLGTGVAAFGAGAHLVAGWWSGGVAGGATAVPVLCCACGWWVRNTDTTVAQWLLAVGIGPLVRGPR